MGIFSGDRSESCPQLLTTLLHVLQNILPLQGLTHRDRSGTSKGITPKGTGMVTRLEHVAELLPQSAGCPYRRRFSATAGSIQVHLDGRRLLPARVPSKSPPPAGCPRRYL